VTRDSFVSFCSNDSVEGITDVSADLEDPKDHAGCSEMTLGACCSPFLIDFHRRSSKLLHTCLLLFLFSRYSQKGGPPCSSKHRARIQVSPDAFVSVLPQFFRCDANFVTFRLEGTISLHLTRSPSFNYPLEWTVLPSYPEQLQTPGSYYLSPDCGASLTVFPYSEARRRFHR